MILFIDTTQGDDIVIALKEGDRVAAQKRVKAKYAQAEKLLPLIDKMLARNKLKIKDIKKIKVVNRGDSPDAVIKTSFTALRIGAVTANALGFALRVPAEGTVKGREEFKNGLKKFNIVEPIYGKEPNITLSCG
ncbi:MAG: hypothetical protein Q8O21_00910 [bacterium]|nr:hypothetical protein [bacterium]